MKRTLAVAALLVAALAPVGAAGASDDYHNVPGKGLGNCGHSSRGGNAQSSDYLSQSKGEGKGNGGLQGFTCVKSGDTVTGPGQGEGT